MKTYKVELTTHEQLAEDNAAGEQLSFPAGEMLVETNSPMQAAIIVARDLKAVDNRDYGFMQVIDDDNDALVYAYYMHDGMWEFHIETYEKGFNKPVTFFII